MTRFSQRTRHNVVNFSLPAAATVVVDEEGGREGWIMDAGQDAAFKNGGQHPTNMWMWDSVN